MLVARSSIEKAYLFDVISKIYVATDSNPVDVASYELASDMVDVVVDVSCIYDTAHAEGFAYDSESASVIRLTGGSYSGMVLYLPSMGEYLALVCLMRAENYKRAGLVEYNVRAFKAALAEVFGGQRRRILESRASSGARR